MAAVASARRGVGLDAPDYGTDSSDVDAEGEEDIDADYSADQTQVLSKNTTNKGEEKGDAGEEENEEAIEEEGEDHQDSGDEDLSEENESGVDAEKEDHTGAEEEGDDEHEAVGAVKLPNGVELNSDGEQVEEGDSENAEADDRDDASADENSSVDSTAVEEWENASAGEGEADVANRNNCIFCKQDEDHDPAVEFEEYLACSVCGDNAHRQCAREDGSLEQDGDIVDANAENWVCPSCAANASELEYDETPLARRLSTSSRLTRDLLPATRGAAPKPGSHSIFNTLIVDDDPLDGSRSLRKRKSSSEALEVQSKASSKRLKRKSDDNSESMASPANSNGDAERAEGDAPGLHAEPDADAKISATLRIGAGNRNRTTNTAQTSRPPRPRRQKAEVPKVRFLRNDKDSLVLAIQVDLSQIKQRPPKKSRRPTTTSAAHARFDIPNPINHYSAPLYSLHDRELDESKSKPYGGILSEAEADTSKTFPTPYERARFEEARQRAEEEWKIKTAMTEAESENKGRTSQKISGPPSKIKCINFGGYEIDTWYAAPYPEEYSRNRVLYICEFCLKYMPSDYVAWRHKLKCPAKHPPGDEIYRDRSVSVFEVDGRKNPVYCQNLCLLAKLFLGSKTLYYDVEPFLFYIMTEYNELGYHFVGYFSKEKRPSSMNNVSCILTLPIHQRKGYGNLLIDFSYLLTRVEQKTGSPEKPLSDMGLVSYRNYWRLVLAHKLLDKATPISITRISELTGMTADDIIAALEALRALVRDPVTKAYALRLDRAFLKETIEKWEAKGYVSLNPDALVWTPYVMGHYNLASYDRGAISTVAPREDEDEQVVPEEGVQQQMQAAAEEEHTHTLNGDISDLVAIGILQQAPRSPPKTNGFHPATLVKPTSPIPLTRYEIYPRVPGTISRRRGHKGGARRTTNSTPAVLSIRGSKPVNGIRASPRSNGVSPRYSATPTSRKTRSALGAEAAGITTPTTAGPNQGVDDDEDDEEVDAEAEADAEGIEDEEEEEEEEEEEDEVAAEPDVPDVEVGEDDDDFEPDPAAGDDDGDEDADAEADPDEVLEDEDAEGEDDDEGMELDDDADASGEDVAME